MPWTKITRKQYQRSGLRYASDLTDAVWALISRKMPGRRRLGRPRQVDLREVVQAIFYILSTGCQWRALPSEFPPYSTVQGYFYAWRDTGRWQRIVRALVRQARRKLGRKPTPTAAVIDTKVLRRHKLAAPAASIPANGFMDASGTSSPIPMVSCLPSTSIPPTSRTSMVRLTCPCRFPPVEVRVRPSEGRTDEASQVYGRADYWRAARA